MNLVIDLGNTNIVFAFYQEKELKHIFRLLTDKNKSLDEYIVIIEKMDKASCFNNVNNVLLSSVVPSLTMVIKEAMEKIFNAPLLLLQAGVKTGLKINIDNPNELGGDLIAGAIGAKNKYGYPIIIVDFGTATKISVVDNVGAYCGCQIIPGLKLSSEALRAKASQLPEISYQAPKKVIGKNTPDSMNSGIIYGTAAMIDGLVNIIEKELGYPCKLIATGGLANYVIPSCNKPFTIDKNILSDGLNAILNKNIKE